MSHTEAVAAPRALPRLLPRTVDPGWPVAVLILVNSLMIYRYNVGPLQLSALRIVLPLAAGAVGLRWLTGHRIRPDAVLLSLAALFVVKLASMLSPDADLGLSYRALFMLVEGTIVYVLTSQTIESTRIERRYCVAMLGALAFADAGGLYQWYAINYDHSITRFPLMQYMVMSDYSEQLRAFYVPDMRLTSLFGDANVFGGFLALTFIYLLPRVAGLVPMRWPLRLLTRALVVLGIVLLAGSQSRSAILGLATGLVVWTVVTVDVGWLRRQFTARAVGGIAVLLVAAAVLGYVSGSWDRMMARVEAERYRAASSGKSALQEHARFMVEGWELLLREPRRAFTGVGEGNYAYRALGVKSIANGHNLFWAAVVEQGVIGVVVLLALFGVLAHVFATRRKALGRLPPAARSQIPAILATSPNVGLAYVAALFAMANTYGHFVYPFIWIGLGILRGQLFLLDRAVKRARLTSAD